MSVDYPRAWQIARAVAIEEHQPDCSFRDGGGGILCDCHVLLQHPDMKRRKLIGVRLWVYTFKMRFVSRVRDERKLRTMRPKRKDGKRPLPGDRISLRHWTGKPYWSKQAPIHDSIVKSVSSVVMEYPKLPCVDGRYLPQHEAELFARYDGFEDFDDMLEWFKHEHGKRVELDMIEWYPKQNTATKLTHEKFTIPAPADRR